MPLDLGHFDINLGEDWMRDNCPVLLDFKNLPITVMKAGKPLAIQGVNKMGVMKGITERGLS